MTLQLCSVENLTPVAWVLTDPSPVTKMNYHTTHVGDRCYLPGCNRPFSREYVAYTEEMGDKTPVCASHVNGDPPQD